MKKFIFLLLICIPFFCQAQHRAMKKRQAYELRLEKQRQQRRSEHVYAGYHLQQASGLMLGGMAAEVAGAALLVYAPSGEGNNGPKYMGALLAGGGLILQVIGIAQIGKAGKIMLSSKGLSVTF